MVTAQMQLFAMEQQQGMRHHDAKMSVHLYLYLADSPGQVPMAYAVVHATYVPVRAHLVHASAPSPTVVYTSTGMGQI